MNNASRFAAVCALVLVAACSEDPRKPSSYGAFVKQIQRINCDALFDCCAADQVAAYASSFTDHQGCLDSFPDFGGLIPTYLRYDAPQAELCLALLEAQFRSCDPPIHYSRSASGRAYLPPECLTVLAGTTRAGELCLDSVECEPDTACIADSTAPDATAHCASGRTLGQACDYFTASCTSDLYCTGSPGVCAAPKQNGGLCGSAAQCQSQRCENQVCVEVTGASLICNNSSLLRD